jgi:alkylation response protein AidB-like acyl-CoA dehydrogenase
VHLGAEFIAGVRGGSRRVGLALNNGSAAAPLVERGRGETVRVDGTFHFVTAPGDIDALLVRGEAGMLLCDLTTGKEQSVEVAPTALIDATMKAGKVELKNAAALRLKSAERLPAIVRVLRAAEMSGAVTRAVEMTVDYVKTRKQFGVPIGGFQAVQHRLADMYANAEALRALTAFAAWSADRSRDQLELSSHAACRFACDVSGEIIEGAIQLHGGIGFTWEYDLHYFLRRVKAIEALWSPSETEHQAIIEAAHGG